jgi:hypothetical protein
MLLGTSTTPLPRVVGVTESLPDNERNDNIPLMANNGELIGHPLADYTY